MAVCERLLEAICNTEVNGISLRIDWHIVQDLYNIAKSKGWELDSEVLQNTAIYLANSSFYTVSKAVKLVNSASLQEQSDRDSIWSFNLNGQEICDISLSRVMRQAKTVLMSKEEKEEEEEDNIRELFDLYAGSQLETAIDIAHALSSRSFVPKSAYFLFMTRAMCVCEQREYAELIFSMAQKHDRRHLGAEYALMMSMYYRLGDSAAANALFTEFTKIWKIYWEHIKSAFVMPDAVSRQAEKWRLVHEEKVEKPLVFDAAELWRIRSRASAPFYQYSLELVRNGSVEQAIKALGEAKYAYFVSLTSMHIGAIIHALLVAGRTDEAFDMYIEFRKSRNASGGSGIRAQDVVFGKLPFGQVTSDLLREIGAINDWNRIWSIIGNSDADLTYGLYYVNTVKALLVRALDTGNRRHAIRCAELLQRIAALHSAALDSLDCEWLEHKFARAIELYPESVEGQPQLVLELLEILVQKNAANLGIVYLSWNSQVIGSFFNSLRQLSDAAQADRIRSSFYASTDLVDALLVEPTSQVLRDEARYIFDLLPESLVSVPRTYGSVSKCGGWGKLDVDIPFAIFSKDSSFWQCTVRAFLSQKSGLQSEPSLNIAYGLLQTIKLIFIKGASIDRKLLVLANDLLLDCGFPVVDIETGGLLPREKQIETKERQTSDQRWIEESKAAETAKAIEMAAFCSDRSSGNQSIKTKDLELRLQEKVQLYIECRKSNEIPELRQLSSLVGDAMRQSKRAIWEPIVRDHIPEYLQRLEYKGSINAASQGKSCESTQYVTTIGSQAIVAYAGLGDIEEAMSYFHRIVDAGGYPISQATAMLLSSLSSTNTLVPVLPRGWSGNAERIFGMEPVYPPQPETHGDTILVPKTKRERKTMVAQIGLAMLYATFKNEIWPTAHFYNILLTVLGKAGMISELRQVFEVISPNSARKMPARLRINPAFAPSPILWAMAIREAAKAGESALSEYWFKEYRMSAMSIFREEASAYSRFAYRDQPKYARLFILGRPYYLVAQLERPLLKDGSLPVPWYDLEQVEKQLEMDRLRALDKLPLSYLDAHKMMTIYTLVDEHRDMDSAETLADEITALYRDKTVPKYSRPRGATDLASCWRMMVSGYIGLLKHYQQQVDNDPSEAKKCKMRLVHWYKQWKKERQRSGSLVGIPGHSRMLLGDQEITLAESICASMR
ncbi:hypothetical protein LPJ64_000538 [Coemansia asiatica]|uniref:Uncharacterized protein n=1 Tax=Coemansia asiatica TaxID=1052880 RepID=A0A9W7XQS6_9FUNG|nr:hypothetical protein LPJ64_000538 [Coemansia asiatica]